MTQLLDSFVAELGNSIEDAVVDAHDRFYRNLGHEVFVVSPGSKASLICDYIYDNLERAIGNSAGVRFVQYRGGRFISLNGEVLIRVKKMNRYLQPKVNKTKQSYCFDHQQLDLLGLPPTTNVYLGYIMDKPSASVDRVVLVCPGRAGSKAEAEWAVDVSKPRIAAPELFPEVEVMPTRRIRVPDSKRAENG